MIVSAISAAILAWQWYRRRRAEGYLRACNKLELGALRASSRGEFGPPPTSDHDWSRIAFPTLLRTVLELAAPAAHSAPVAR